MTFFEWKPEMSVGIDAIDADHQLLIELINELALHTGAVGGVASREADDYTLIGQIFDSLNRYIRLHFQREERVLATVNYKDLDSHRSLHSNFVAEIARLQLDYYKNHDSKVPLKLCQYLKNWLNNHILIDDMAYKEEVSRNPEAQRVAAALEPIRRAKD